MNFRALGLIVIIEIGLLLCQGASQASCNNHDQVVPDQPPRLFDFVSFKARFNKHYGSLVEEISRHRLYLVKTLKASVSQAKYKLGLVTSFSAVNEFSDWTPEERKNLERTFRSPSKHLKYANQSRGDPAHHQHHVEKRNARGDSIEVDISKDACMGGVKRQYSCGSCYAFSSLALWEFYFCRATGEQGIVFSEQFPVDCGRPYGLDGCDGGTFRNMTSFVAEMGLDLAIQYPYQNKELSCLYYGRQRSRRTQVDGGDTSPASRAGFYKLQFEPVIKSVPRESWTSHLARDGPIYVTVDVDGDTFLDYGGGVYLGDDCESSHAVVLVGSGRENGRDYWLIRNSFGQHWGVNGHYKVSKQSQCLDESGAAIVPTRRGRTLKWRKDLFAVNPNWMSSGRKDKKL